MNISDKIASRIEAAKAWDSQAQLSDFQIRVVEKGAVLVNLRTGRAQLIYPDNADAAEADESIAQ